LDVWAFEKLKVQRVLCCRELARARWQDVEIVRCQAYIAYVKSTFHPMLTPEAETVLTKSASLPMSFLRLWCSLPRSCFYG
jgi:hypothetical protein